ncbi:c-type cytochrome [Methylibium sp.]|uniref:c-type cytochrome n=1 Tax=Methylibium sp. TaxID=2067992 RepID=UPI003D0E7DEA
MRWLQLCAGLSLVGMFAIQWLAGEGRSPAVARWRAGLQAVAPWLVAMLLVCATGLLMLKAASITGRAEAALDWAELKRIILQTRFGQVWAVRQVLALGLLLLARCGRVTGRVGECGLHGWFAALAALHLALAAMAGHGAATEPIWLAGAGHVMHLLGAAVWAGALPAMGYGLCLAARSEQETDRDYFAAALRRFSALAGASVLMVVLSGSIIGYLQLGAPTGWPAGGGDVLGGLFSVLERVLAPLLGTAYGLQVFAKALLLVPVLLFAARVRFVCMPRFGSGLAQRRLAMRSAARWVGLELGAVVVILALAASVTGTIPAAHDRVVWRLPMRWSAAATWDQPGVAAWVMGAASLTIASLLFGGLSWWRARHRSRPAGRLRSWIVGLTAVGGAVACLYALSVPAYPDTFRRTETPYKAVSIARGAELYLQHCVACHGAGGRGDGPLAARLKVKPANLTEPHTALHTAGDIFWWLTHGKPEGGMPGFEAKTSVEERWDLVNFLRAFSAGHQARILTAGVVPNRPWLGAPDFDFGTEAGVVGSLKDYRDKQAVLLVFYSLPYASGRLHQLADSYPKLRASNVEVIAVPLRTTSGLPPPGLPFPTVKDGAREAATTYLLFRRTLSDAGSTVLGEAPAHLELLIDRFGYARARWLTNDLGGSAAEDWLDTAYFLHQVDLLNREGRILPSPDEHVH